MPSKTEARLYYSIREVAEMLELEPYVLRFWEKEFPTLKPKKSNGGLRLYKQKDIDELRIIRELLYVEKYTIEGAKRQITTGRRDGLMRLRYQNQQLRTVVSDAVKELKLLRKKLD
jgi:DNA-binding transcriptional MerR regulator